MSNEENKTTDKSFDELVGEHEKVSQKTIEDLLSAQREQDLRDVIKDASNDAKLARLLNACGSGKNPGENVSARVLRNAGLAVSEDKINGEPHRILPEKPLYEVTKTFLDGEFKKYAANLSNAPTKQIADKSLSDYLNSIEDADWFLSSVVQNALQEHWGMSGDVAAIVMTQFIERIGKTFLPKTTETIILDVAEKVAANGCLPPFESGISKIGELELEIPHLESVSDGELKNFDEIGGSKDNE